MRKKAEHSQSRSDGRKGSRREQALLGVGATFSWLPLAARITLHVVLRSALSACMVSQSDVRGKTVFASSATFVGIRVSYGLERCFT